MAIDKQQLEKMNDLISKGATISKLAEKFPSYDYWEIYSSVNDYSLLGKKRGISNRLKKLRNNLPKEDRNLIIDEIQEALDDIYNQSKNNGRKLLAISHRLSAIDKILKE